MLYIQEVQKPSQALSAEAPEDDPYRPSFFIFPVQTTKQTYLKAPMAHKTFSQEQFVSTTYSIAISFSSQPLSSEALTSTNDALFLALRLRASYSPFETNLFFLKRFRFAYTASDALHMTF